jgi:DNA-binding PadR family transcriptional regulator
MTVRSSLLGLLAESPATGYGLKQRYEERTGALWPVNIGQVYKTLARLEGDGLVTRGGDGGDDASPYELTERGRDELAGWLVEPVEVAAGRDELVVKVLLACGTPDLDGLDVIQRHRSALVEELQRITHGRGTSGDKDLTWLMLMDALVLRLDAAIRWLDRCEARLASAGKEAGR